MKNRGASSASANQVAIADSYAAVVANASPARRLRVSSDSSPDARSSVSTGWYCSARDTAATFAKFFAAPRSIDGPPTSIISTASSSPTPRRPATSANG
jgi:hypothetical protein